MPQEKEKKKLFTATFWFEGKRYYVRSTKTQRDAERKASKRQSEMEEGAQLIGDNISVADYARQWVEIYKKETVSNTVYQSYLTRINRHILPKIGHLKMRDIKPSHLQGIMNAQAGMSKTHCDKLRFAIRGIFDQAVRDKIIRDNPSEDLKLPKAKDQSHRSITEAERAAILAVAETHRFGLFVKTMLFCGLRPQEAAALQWRDIDCVNKRIMVRRALKKDGFIADTKTDSGVRDIPIPPPLWTSLSPLIPANNINDYVFLTVHNARYSHTAMRKAWESYRRQIDIALGAQTVRAGGTVAIVSSVIAPDLTMYCLRHTYCTDLEAAGVPINIAKYLMGHSSITLTSKIYTHIREDSLSDAAQKIALFGATVGATQNPEITLYKPDFPTNPELNKIAE